MFLHLSPQGRSPLQLDLSTKEGMQSVLDVQSIFLLTSLSATAGHVPHTAREFCHAEITASAPQLEAHLQAAPVEQFPENDDIVQQSGRQVADRGPLQCLTISAEKLTVKRTSYHVCR
jgi:hypothetical protein